MDDCVRQDLTIKALTDAMLHLDSSCAGRFLTRVQIHTRTPIILMSVQLIIEGVQVYATFPGSLHHHGEFTAISICVLCYGRNVISVV